MAPTPLSGHQVLQGWTGFLSISLPRAIPTYSVVPLQQFNKQNYLCVIPALTISIQGKKTLYAHIMSANQNTKYPNRSLIPSNLAHPKFSRHGKSLTLTFDWYANSPFHEKFQSPSKVFCSGTKSISRERAVMNKSTLIFQKVKVLKTVQLI